jgi:hypothetical protein
VENNGFPQEVTVLLGFQEYHRELKIPSSVVSQLFHLVLFSTDQTAIQKLKQGMLIFSIDVDVGSRVVGIVNKGRNDRNVHNYFSEQTVGEIEEKALPLFLELFDQYGVPVTFGIRGQTLEVDGTILEQVIKSSVHHDIGSHGFSHKMFNEMSSHEVDSELNKLGVLMKDFNVTPTSFIFPKNAVAHLDFLEKYGYKTYRSYGNFRLDCMRIEKRGNLYNINPSLNLDQSINSSILCAILKIAILKRAPLHLWFHLWNFGVSKLSIERSINRVFRPLLKYAQSEANCGTISLETMASAQKKVEPFFKPKQDAH